MSSVFLSLLNFKISDVESESLMVRQGPFEIRMNPRMICAKIAVGEKCQESASEGLQALQDYFHGNNFRVQNLAPIGPIFEIHKSMTLELGILFPSGLSLSDIPKPVNRSVKIEEIPSTKIGCLRFRGAGTREIIQRRGEELKKWIKYRGLNSSGAVRFFRHKFFIPGLGQNEVQVDLL